MTQDSSPAIAPGSTIGILGGGQLGRMAAIAAARLGYHCHIFCPDPESPAFEVAARHTCAAYDDEGALAAFAADCDVVTFEFENIPVATVNLLAARIPVRPDWTALETSQDRVLEKRFFNEMGAKTAPWQAVSSLDDLRGAIANVGLPAILKTRRMGYDGKGQVQIDRADRAESAWRAIGGVPAILEGYVSFSREVSAIVARSPRGEIATFDIAENLHVNHILDTTRVPAAITEDQASRAAAIAHRAAEVLNLEGLLAVEMFIADDGQVLVNEMAPRPHNSGHWTIDACVTDQFEQFIRAVCNLRLGSPERHCDAEMKNLLGDAVENWAAILAEPKAKLHLYGKAEARTGRKMGHVTRVFPRWKDRTK